MPREFEFVANDSRAFVTSLRKLGRKVGPRSGLNKRTKDDLEWYCFRRYAATLAAHTQWSFPCKVSMGERPDFMISFGDISRGLEVTAATTQIFQRSLTLSEKSDAECEIIDEDGWAGDAPEREWSEAVGMAIAAKVKLISSYRPAGHHDILVYSNHPSDVVRRVNGQHSGHDKLRALAALCAPCWTQEPRLGTISVLDGSILLFDLIGRAEPWPILDLRSGFSKRVNE